MFEVTQSAVNEATRPRRDTRTKVFLFDQCDTQTAFGRVARDTEPVDARTDDDEVEVRAICRVIHKVSPRKM